jgi:hypothetical protein
VLGEQPVRPGVPHLSFTVCANPRPWQIRFSFLGKNSVRGRPQLLAQTLLLNTNDPFCPSRTRPTLIGGAGAAMAGTGAPDEVRSTAGDLTNNTVPVTTAPISFQIDHIGRPKPTTSGWRRSR